MSTPLVRALLAAIVLLAGSPLLGASSSGAYGRDVRGAQRPNPPSIGAYDVATLRRVLVTDPAA